MLLCCAKRRMSLECTHTIHETFVVFLDLFLSMMLICFDFVCFFKSFRYVCSVISLGKRTWLAALP